MVITHYEGTYFKDNQEREWHSFSVDFKFDIVNEIAESEPIVRPIEVNVSKLKTRFPSESRRRELAYHLLKDVKWRFSRKYRDIIIFETEDIDVEMWEALVFLCEGKWKLTEEMYQEMYGLTPKELVQSLKSIRIATELGK